MNRKTVGILVALFLFLTVVFQVSAGGVRFADKVPVFDREVCQARKINLLGSVICYLIDKTNELSNSVQVLNSQLSANEATDATQSAKISQLEQRVSTLESFLTPTAIPTLAPQSINDQFDGQTLDTNVWEFFSTDGGNYSFSNGSLIVPGSTSMFYIRTKNNPFPTSGSFTVEFGIQYTTVNPSGTGLALGTNQQNGYDQSNIVVSYWQDSASGLDVSRFGLLVASMGGIDTSYHIGKIEYDGDKYKVYLDNVLKYTSPSSPIAKTIWFGNPYCCSTIWTGFNLDYIKVTKP